MSNKICKNCRTNLIGEYCHTCGEKVVTDKDFSFSKLLGQVIDIFTHLDSKLFRTAAALLFRPGYLSKSYVEGLRKPFMKPFQVFFISNLLFFFFLGNIDMFYIPHQWFFDDRLWGIQIQNLVNADLNRLGVSIKELASIYDQKASTAAKVLVIFIIPGIALFSYLINLHKIKYYGKHIIFSAHFLSFFMILILFIFLLGKLFPQATNIIPLILAISIPLFIYLIFAIKSFTGNKIVLAFFQALLLLFVFYGCIYLYRSIISLFVLKYLV